VAPLEDVRFALLSQGFTNIEITLESSAYKIFAIKPAYETGTKSKLTFAKKADATKDLSWLKAAANDDELEDEDALLDESDYVKPVIPSMEDGQPKKKKACKNCSCGLKELEEEEAKKETAEVITVQPKSSCGSVN
jgi:hypothetical protein